MKPLPHNITQAIRYCAKKNENSYYADVQPWGIPEKYKTTKDREVSAITACLFYDGTESSLKVAKEMDLVFDGEPYKFIANKTYQRMLMSPDQNRRHYKAITIKNVYMFFCKLYEIYAEFPSIYSAFLKQKGDTDAEKLMNLFGKGVGFSGLKIDIIPKFNLFLVMMAHRFDDYDYDPLKLVAPVFRGHFTFYRRIKITEEKKFSNKSAEIITEQFGYFSKTNPMTFWIGAMGLRECMKLKKKYLSKFNDVIPKRYYYKKK